MKFELNVGSEVPPSEPTAQINLYLQKNADGSVGLFVRNSALRATDTDAEVLRIKTNGVITRSFFVAGPYGNAFFQYVAKGQNTTVVKVE
jgi:hypothetical protein